MQAPTVIRNGKTRTVTNLGWLLKNWKLVESFHVSAPVPCYSAGMSPCPGGPLPDAILTANLRDGGFYVTDYASSRVLASFLHRPVFDTLPVDWYGSPEIIGKDFARKYGL